jgi:hypothetical protein
MGAFLNYRPSIKTATGLGFTIDLARIAADETHSYVQWLPAGGVSRRWMPRNNSGKTGLIVADGLF